MQTYDSVGKLNHKDGWFAEWAHCDAGHLKFFTNGTVLGGAVGLACLVFGKECAVYIGGTCAVKSTFWDWDTSGPY